MTASQPTEDESAGWLSAFLGWDRYPSLDDAEPVGEIRFTVPLGYVALFTDGEVWDVAGFDRRGNAVIALASGDYVRANAYPTYRAEGLAVTA